MTGTDGTTTMPYGAPAGGAKRIAINIANNTVYKIDTIPQTVHYPDSYMNDVRFDNDRLGLSTTLRGALNFPLLVLAERSDVRVC